MQQPYAIIWDMDGVLVDSGPYHYRAWKQIMHEIRHHDISADEFRRTFGLRNAEMLRLVLGEQLGDVEMEHLSDVKEARYRELVQAEGLELLPGTRAWLDSAQDAGWLQAVASSAPRANVEAVVDAVGIRNYFGAMISAEDVSHGKPDPEVFLTAARKLGIPASQCVVVEDAPAGVQGARSAGMACIGIYTTHATLDADLMVESLAHIPFASAQHLVDGRSNDRKG